MIFLLQFPTRIGGRMSMQNPDKTPNEEVPFVIIEDLQDQKISRALGKNEDIRFIPPDEDTNGLQAVQRGEHVNWSELNNATPINPDTLGNEPDTSQTKERELFGTFDDDGSYEANIIKRNLERVGLLPLVIHRKNTVTCELVLEGEGLGSGLGMIPKRGWFRGGNTALQEICRRINEYSSIWRQKGLIPEKSRQ